MQPVSKHEQTSRSGGPPEKRPPRARTCTGLIRTRRRDGRVLPLLAVLAVTLSVLFAAACGATGRGDASAADAKAGQEAGSQESTPAPSTTATETTAAAGPTDEERGKTGAQANEAGARAGDAVARDGSARAGEAEAGTGKDVVARAGDIIVGEDGVEIAGSGGEDAGGDAEDGNSGEVTLKLTGDRGTRYSGACSVGGTERALEGRVPERYVFEPQGEGLECELRTEGGGALGIVFTDGAGVTSQQRTTAGESTLRFVYSNGGISSSTFSKSGGRTVTYSEQNSSERSR